MTKLSPAYQHQEAISLKSLFSLLCLVFLGQAGCRLCQYLSPTQVLSIEHDLFNLSSTSSQRANMSLQADRSHWGCSQTDIFDQPDLTHWMWHRLLWMPEISLSPLTAILSQTLDSGWFSPRSAIISSDWKATPYLEAAESFSEQGHPLTQVCILIMPWRTRFQGLQYDAQ